MNVPRSALLPCLLVTFFVLFLALTGCRITGGSAGIAWGDPAVESEQPGESGYDPSPGKGPPAHAPAHGYRRKFQYDYYPAREVYRDVERGLYFYYEDGKWTTSVTLPRSIEVQLGDSVRIEMDTDKPYEQHEEQQQKYPPGQAKKKGWEKNDKKTKW